MFVNVIVRNNIISFVFVIKTLINPFNSASTPGPGKFPCDPAGRKLLNLCSICCEGYKGIKVTRCHQGVFTTVWGLETGVGRGGVGHNVAA